MALIEMNQDFVNKTIKTDTNILIFKYNTSNDYFYYDLYDLNNNIIAYHNRVITGNIYDNFNFISTDNQELATLETIENWKLFINE